MISRMPFLYALLIAVACCCAVQAKEPLAVQIHPDVAYGHKDGLALTMDVYQPPEDGNGAAIMFMISGGWYSRWSPPEKKLPLFKPYIDAGYTFVAVRHGSSPRYSIPEAVSDVRRSVRFFRQNAGRFKVDPDRLAVMGTSAGGHLALMLGTTGDDGNAVAKDELQRVSSRVAAVVAFVPPTDLRVAVWDAPESLPAYRGFPALNLPLDEAEQHSPLVHVTQDDAPALVFMGGADKLVPAKHGEWIDKAFTDAVVPHKYIVFPEAGHNVITEKNREMVISTTIEWFDSYLLSE